ncbi:MAG: hypothetical protein V2I35_09680, partial [Desulfocapsaceae bacterium]|nr:hypothetical protein [Desulfocapsaceae bacterium]
MARTTVKTDRVKHQKSGRQGAFSAEIEDSHHVAKKRFAPLRKQDRLAIVNASLVKYFQGEDLKPYQAELIKMQRHLERNGKKMIILFDGRDASGKGGTIRRVTRYMNEKHYRVVALGKPNAVQQT